MRKLQILIIAGLMQLAAGAQIPLNHSMYPPSDTLKSFLVSKDSNFLYHGPINHQNNSFGKKIVRGTFLASGYNISMGTYLIIAPEHISKWNKKEKFRIGSIIKQYQKSYTESPIFDYDLWYINYVGHPYQGSFYYNTIRSQRASVLQSSLFCVGQSLFWEYGWEAGMEQPSIQDLITTPVAGIIIGELTHVATIKMSKHGFRWYEALIVCIINPGYAINNGFKHQHSLKN
jgi:hypothetical protein